MSEPRPGERFFDTKSGRVVVYSGDHGQSPWWQDWYQPWRSFCCDWHDYYLWGRFKRL